MKKPSLNIHFYRKENGKKSIQPKTSWLEFFKATPYPEIELDIQRSKDVPRKIEL